MARSKLGAVAAGLVLLSAAVAGSLMGVSAASTVAPLVRGGRVSSVARPDARGQAWTHPGLAPATTCSTPGSGNYIADCNSTGRPVNETSIAYNGRLVVAGANDYNSWNGNADLGYYSSPDAKTWTDDGPLDLFPHGSNTAAGDPGLAVDSAGVVYYSGIYFDYNDCNVGGVELARYDPASGTWSYYQIRANSDAEFQDKPAIMQDGRHVFVSWTKYESCSGIGVASPIVVAIFNPGPTSTPPVKKLAVPGSTYSQGSAMASDGRGGFWITWEEFPSPTSTIGSIMLSRWAPRSGWSSARTISPPGFTDLPSPLPGFLFRDNSFPMIAFGAGQPRVVWASYDSGMGRVYLWQGGQVTVVSDSGGDQFFPSIALDPQNVNWITWSQTDQANQSFDQYIEYGLATKISTASSFPNNDPYFFGTFIGDYNSIVGAGVTPHPIWTDVRGPTYAQNAMVYAA